MNDNIKQLEYDIEFANCTNKCKQTRCGLAPCCRENIAIYLDGLGYRKQSDTAREIYNKIYDNLPQACDWTWLQGAHWAMQIAAEFVEVEK
jgi:hypothetical protein